MKTTTLKRKFNMTNYETYDIELTIERKSGEPESTFMVRAMDSFNEMIKLSGVKEEIRKRKQSGVFKK